METTLSDQNDQDAYTITEFCARNRVGRSALYKMWQDGTGPRRFQIGTGRSSKVLISAEAGADCPNSDKTDIPTNAASPAILIVAPPLPRSAVAMVNLPLEWRILQDYTTLAAGQTGRVRFCSVGTRRRTAVSGYAT